MGRPLHLEVADRPATAAVVVLCGAWWLYIKQKNLQYEDVGMSYEKVVNEKQYWRIVVSQFSHIDFVHILFNLATLWSLGVVERAVPHGSSYYLQCSFLMLLVTGVVLLAGQHVAIRHFRGEGCRRVHVVGYSGVLFGWMTLVALRHSGGVTRFSILGLASVPMAAAPFLYLALTQLLVPRASFWGHLAGILAGFLAASGIFNGISAYWTICLAMWTAIGVLYGLVQQGVIGMPYFRIINPLENDLERGAGYPPVPPIVSSSAGTVGRAGHPLPPSTGSTRSAAAPRGSHPLLPALA